MNFPPLSILGSNPGFCTLCIFSLFVFTSGLSAGSAIKIFLPLKKNPGNSRAVRNPDDSTASRLSANFCSSGAFSATCVFLAFAAILYTVMIFLTHNLFPLQYFHEIGVMQGFSNSFYNAVHAIIFVWGILLALCWKILLPLSLVFYISLSVFTNVLLYKTFGTQRQSIPLKIEESSREIKVTVYTLPDILIIPAKRNWFLVDSDFYEKTSPLFSNPAVNFYLSEFLLSRAPKQFVLRPPAGQAYPGLYSLRITFSKDLPKCELVREL